MDAVYTHGHHESVLRSHRWRTAANSAAYLLPHLQPWMSLLDVGSGPGAITADLARRVARVTASEESEQALALARAGVEAGGAGNVDFAVADAHRLDFPGASFDVHAHQVLQHVGDPYRLCGRCGMWAERILGSAMADQALATGAATEDDLRRISRGWLEWAEAGDGRLSILHGEILC